MSFPRRAAALVPGKCPPGGCGPGWVLCLPGPFPKFLGTAPVARYIPSLFVDITASYERKCQALDCFAAQPGLGERYGWLARYRALEAQSTAWMQGCEYAEGFVRLGTEMAGFSGPMSSRARGSRAGFSDFFHDGLNAGLSREPCCRRPSHDIT